MKFFPAPAKNTSLRFWLAYFVMGAALVALTYSVVQQNYRQTANDPQIQMAEDAVLAIDTAGATPASLVPATKVNMRTSLAPFLIVLDDNLNVIASSGSLDGHTVVPPKGALEAARDSAGKDTTQAAENRVTWQPASGVREAAVITHYSGGYIVAARSLREVEVRETNLGRTVGFTFLGLLVAGLVLAVIFR